MKTSVLRLAATLALLLLAASGCKKSDKPLTSAVITGYDPRMCACCGGLILNFNGETSLFAKDFKLIENANDLGLAGNEHFPLFVQVEWVSLASSCGGGEHIKITRFQRK
jgi:hypothetical protein